MLVEKDIYLSSIKSKDLPFMLKWINDRSNILFNSHYKPVSEIEHKDWFERISRDSEKFLFGIYTKKNDEIIGSCQLIAINLIDRNAELQIRIGATDKQGKGYGTQAVKLLVKFAFDDLNLDRVYLFVFTDNIRAIKTYKRNGFIEEGVLRKHAHIDGKYKDVMIMGKIRKEND